MRKGNLQHEKPASHSRGLTVRLTILFNSAFGYAGHALGQPDVIFIRAEGFGYPGSGIKTSKIAHLAAESALGVLVCAEHLHSAPAALVAGRSSMRHGLQTLLIFSRDTSGTISTEKEDTGYPSGTQVCADSMPVQHSPLLDGFAETGVTAYDYSQVTADSGGRGAKKNVLTCSPN